MTWNAERSPKVTALVWCQRFSSCARFYATVGAAHAYFGIRFTKRLGRFQAALRKRDLGGSRSVSPQFVPDVKATDWCVRTHGLCTRMTVGRRSMLKFLSLATKLSETR